MTEQEAKALRPGDRIRIIGGTICWEIVELAERGTVVWRCPPLQGHRHLLTWEELMNRVERL